MSRTLRCIAIWLLLTSCAWAAHMERDDAGRSVAVPDHVHRLVSLSPSLTDTVYALGASSDLVGITDYTSYPPEAAREKPSVGAVVNPSLERIVALHPDMVLALPAFNGAETIAGLERVGIPVFLVSTGSVRGYLSQHRQCWASAWQRTRSDGADRRLACAGEQGSSPVGEWSKADRAAGAVGRSADYRREGAPS